MEYYMFNGILNNNGFEEKIRILIDSRKCFPYKTDAYIDNVKYSCTIDYNTIMIGQTNYDYIIKTVGDEILIVGKEKRNIMHLLLCCIYKPKFFVLTNKQEV